MPTKHDAFFDDTTCAANGVPNYPSLTGAVAPYGYGPWLTDNLWFVVGCNMEGNVHGRRLDNGNFQPDGFGIGAVINPSAAINQGNAWPKFTDDRSRMGSDTGGGDYRPASGSPLIGVASVANLDTDRAGVARGGAFAAGALEAS
ncbi:hypothetical protein [Sphingomonas turrisvirgatae]|uniref:Uncharacterized protein n=1 Tax=Sphingomonas turrisvirgatae TaxID=1888892 RepID=A0A1E3LRU8_9SPHN|nr:hypothetical protein [Sphingomonas turrisvirgatae]ODP36482.1 hypothetical protein BFL28_05705 [Sphingomonas turrisvirgatae]